MTQFPKFNDSVCNNYRDRRQPRNYDATQTVSD